MKQYIGTEELICVLMNYMKVVKKVKKKRAHILNGPLLWAMFIYDTLFFKNKKLCTIFYHTYAFAAFNFLAKLDFFLAAVFLTIIPFVQAWSIFLVA